MPRPRVAVVGAGVAGLTAARNLSASDDVVVVDKGRGVGGRLATRRIGEATFDHGAQFITTHTPEFAEIVAGWERAGVARPWFQVRIGPDGITDPDGHTRFRGVATMSRPIRSSAVSLAHAASFRPGRPRLIGPPPRTPSPSTPPRTSMSGSPAGRSP